MTVTRIEDWDGFDPDDPGPPEPGHTSNGTRPAVDPDLELDPSLQPVDLQPILDGTHQQPVPTLLTRDDGRSLFYPGSVNGIHGDSGAGKGFVICHLIHQNALQAKRTLLLDFEDTASSIVARLRILGMTDDQILTWFIYLRPQVPLGPGAVTHLCELATSQSAAATILDSVGEAFSLEGLDENKDVEVGPWYRRVARPLAETGTAVGLVDHATKSADNPLHPSGSKRKRAAITGASYLAEAVVPFVKGQGGRLRLTCAKDRHGTYRRGEVVADLFMTAEGRLTLYAPTPALTADATVPTLLAARAAVAAAKQAGRAVSRNALEGLMKIKTRAETKRGGIDYAVSEGALVSTKVGQTIHLTYHQDLMETN